MKDERKRHVKGIAPGIVSCLLLAATAFAEEAPACGAEAPSARRRPGRAREPETQPPSLERLREMIVRRGVAPRLVRIEGIEAADDAAAASTSERPRSRLVFWTKTGRLTQTVIVAVIAGPEAPEEHDAADAGPSAAARAGAYVRVQSADLARVPATHPRLAEVMAYMLDRNFAMTGAQFARDGEGGEVAIRADVPCAGGLSEAGFLQALESVVRAADEEAPRLEAVLGGDGNVHHGFHHGGTETRRAHGERPFWRSLSSVSGEYPVGS